MNLNDSLGKMSIILFCDLCLIRWSIECRWIVIDIFDMNNNRGVIFIQIVRGNQSQLVLLNTDKRVVTG